MKTSFRLVFFVILVFFTISAIFSFFQIRFERNRLAEELEGQLNALSNNLMPSIGTALSDGDREELKELLEWGRDEDGLLGVLIYNSRGLVTYVTEGLLTQPKKWVSHVHKIISQNQKTADFRKMENQLIYYQINPIVYDHKSEGTLVLIKNAKYIEELTNKIWLNNFICFLVLIIPNAILVFLILRWRTTALSRN